MNEVAWDDLKLFLHVAETGSLSGAARQTGLSAATVGRRVLALEQQTGLALFERSQTGYELTVLGVDLMRRVKAMRAAALPVQEMLSGEAAPPLIRISAGTGTAAFLADRFAALSRQGDGFRLNFVTTEAVLDIAHRQVDLGIRNREATSGNLATRRLARLKFAPYRSFSAPEPTGWVALDPVHARHAAAHWVHREGYQIAALASSVSTVHELIRAGAGIGIVPCMIGDCDPALTRAGAVIDELTEDQYLIMHNDDRHRPVLRRLIARIVQVYRDNRALLAGERALRGGA